MNEHGKRIAREIAVRGPIPFARFMELALYCPVYGYYEREEDIIGKRGDFFTNVSVGSLFGEILAFRFAEWLEISPEAGSWQLVEAGAHDGRLALDILAWLQKHRRRIFDRVQYFIVEPSRRRQEWQERTLRDFAGKVQWRPDLAGLRQSGDGASRSCRPIRGILFSNELLDAMPVHRLGWDAGRRTWFEWGVTVAGEEFVWSRLAAPLMENTAFVPSQLLGMLPDGFILEVCPQAKAWWQEAASLMDRGRLLTIDYGLTFDELLNPARTQGTLRGFRKHRQQENLLADPGDQDLTAHINFSELQEAGELAGLRTEAFMTQEKFLGEVASRFLKEVVAPGNGTRERLRQYHTLTHPEHLGVVFRTLIQVR